MASTQKLRLTAYDGPGAAGGVPEDTYLHKKDTPVSIELASHTSPMLFATQGALLPHAPKN